MSAGSIWGLAGRFFNRFDGEILDSVYRVERQPDGKTTWTTRENGKEVVLDSEPGMGLWKHIGMFFMRVMPLENQL